MDNIYRIMDNTDGCLGNEKHMVLNKNEFLHLFFKVNLNEL